MKFWMTLLMDYIHIEVSQGPPFCGWSQFMLALYKSTLRMQAAKASDLSSRQQLSVAVQSTTTTADNDKHYYAVWRSAWKMGL